MPTITPYPNGQTLTSTALTPTQMNDIIQPLTCGMIGINPPNLALVRVDWQTQGQPFIPTPANDVCFISCVPEDVDYHKVRDRVYTNADGGVTETWTYTRGWRVSWVLYGPNSTDHACMIHSAVIFIDYFSDQLSLSNLYPLSEPAQPTRVPEELNAQWYERADFHITLYEAVTETIEYGAVTSVAVTVNTVKESPAAEFTVST
jgi:hypothetical protein